MIWFKHRHAMLQEAKRANDLRSHLADEVMRLRMDITSYRDSMTAFKLTSLIDLSIERTEQLLEKERANAAATE